MPRTKTSIDPAYRKKREEEALRRGEITAEEFAKLQAPKPKPDAKVQATQKFGGGLSKEDFEAVKGLLGFQGARGGIVTPKARAIAEDIQTRNLGLAQQRAVEQKAGQIRTGLEAQSLVEEELKTKGLLTPEELEAIPTQGVEVGQTEQLSALQQGIEGGKNILKGVPDFLGTIGRATGAGELPIIAGVTLPTPEIYQQAQGVIALGALSAAAGELSPAVTSVTTTTASTGGIASSVTKLAVGGAVAGIPLKLQRDSKQAIISSRQEIATVLSSLRNGDIDLFTSVQLLDQIERNLDSLESSMNTWGRLSVLNYLGGGKDNLVDARVTRQQLELARNQLPRIVEEARIAEAREKISLASNF